MHGVLWDTGIIYRATAKGGQHSTVRKYNSGKEEGNLETLTKKRQLAGTWLAKQCSSDVHSRVVQMSIPGNLADGPRV